MYKKLNPVRKNFLSLLIVIFSLVFFTLPLCAQPDHQWTVMVYMAADNSSMDTAMADLQKMINVGSSDDIAIMVLLDNSDGDSSYYGIVNAETTPLEWCNNNPTTKVSMGDYSTLVSFVSRVTDGNSANNYALILWNATELYDSGDGKLSVKELGEALADLYRREININLVGFDADLMGMLEVAYEIKDYADVMVASEKTEQFNTWPYDDILQDLTNTPTMNSQQLGTTIVTRYGESYGGNNTLSAVQLKEQSGNYSASDLVGTWDMHSLQSGDSELHQCGWSRGTVTIDGSGIMTWTLFFDSDRDTSMQDTPNIAFIDPGGIVTVDTVESDTTFHGVMSQDKSMVVGTVGDVGEGSEFIVLQKSGGTFEQSDLSGTWNMHSLQSGDSELHQCGWSRGTVTIDGSNMVWTSFLDSENETSMQDTPLTVSMYSEHVVYINGGPGGNNSFHGVMSDKNTVVGTMTSGDGADTDYELIVLQKSGGTFATSDLKGAWNMHSLRSGWSGDINESGWSHGTVNIDYSGNMTWTSFVDSDSGDTSPEDAPDIAYITLGGIVSLGNHGTFQGIMSGDKNMVVATMTGGDGENKDYDFIVLQKSGGTFATIKTLANAVSDFADTVLIQDNDWDWDVIFGAQQRAGYYTYLSYRDLEGFVEGVVDNPLADTQTKTAAQNVINEFEGCIIANHSSVADKGNGLSIYFPEWFYEGVDSDYNETNLLFLRDIPADGVAAYEQYWDNFLYKYVSAYLVPSHTGAQPYSRNIPGGTTASAYVMVSSPVAPDNPDPLANLQDDLGPYDPNIWRLFRWNPTLSGYGEYPSGDTDLALGKGFWLISRNTVNIDVTGIRAETNSPYFILLYPGWNQIGTPFNFDIDLDMVWVAVLRSVKGAKTIVRYENKSDDNIEDYFVISDVPSAKDITSQTLWKYEDGDYSATAVMNPGEGYWIENLTTDYVLLLVNPVRHTLSECYIDSLERTLTAFGKTSEETPPPPPGGIDPEPKKEGSSGKSGCFIATACFGSPMAREVNVLRNFRNKYLLSNTIGQIFVSLYYRYSPPIADFIAKHNFLKVAVRSTLYPIVKGCEAFIDNPHTN